MADAVPPKRVLPARDRGDSRAKRRASSPVQPAATPTARKASTLEPSTEPPRQKRPYTKRASLVRFETPASRSSPSVSIAEEALPTRLVVNKPLPTSREKQPTSLSPNEYQSIAESAILAASLYRSRMQWLCDGVFKKYWVKPVKRKGVIEAPPNNPDVKSMAKLGGAAITIEPHIFDVFFYTVKDPSAPQPQPQPQPQPFHRHPNQHTAKQMIPPPPPYGTYHSPGPHQVGRASLPGPTPPPQSHGLPPTPIPVAQAPPAPSPNPPATQPSSSSTPPSGPPKPTSQEAMPVQTQSAPPPSQSASVAPSPKTSAQTPLSDQKQPSQPPSGRQSTTDPVIQMLAARAASDPQLKELMKVVATSKASPEQLKEFQAHIDEFNEVVRRQEAERPAKNEELPSSKTPSIPAVPASAEGEKDIKPESKPPTPQQANPVQTPKPVPTSAAAHPSTYSTPQAPPRPPAHPTANGLPGVMHTFPHQAHGPNMGGPTGGYMGYHATPPQPRPEPIIKHIVLEITSTPSGSQSASTDRWLFPEYAVLELRQGGLEMLCSFLVERRGSEILAGMGSQSAEGDSETSHTKWKADQEYYVPVTMTVKATNHRTIESIARAAKLLPQVQEYMKKVLDKGERAPREYLVHQLPREVTVGADGTEGFVDSGVELASESSSEDDELKDVYGI
ncbi:hypothetical protein LTR99_002372 [Exophiala xenobiotica]|uniref:SWR1-complex protein 3 domain-containing protein n=1 Tax=Vermiconidia calcicola TaxID=1690605 RepID=A0AAV9QI15_9PEZI|nr:hypothetical protein LTR99_002372 [Exophiala xenobiotica]KAK5434058.1 hypothetical protein LTR34_003570 [Exophiala xenobiotica]KAK5541554.1 hypothetical protein LTR23_005876 [Chaetothyriales sp. CCFEE 6169]KAK5542290.1 hypothetical protein LTR25_002175 [Vermiconidia calcicola]